jgi:serine/threonine protein kinase
MTPGTTWWVKLADFGISKRIDLTIATSTVAVGTWDYMAPELFMKGQSQSLAVDSRAADIWAVGAMAYFLLTKSRNYLSRRLIAFDEQTSLDFLPTDIELSEGARSFLVNATERDPEKRLKWKTACSHAWVKLSTPSAPVIVSEDAEYADLPTNLLQCCLIMLQILILLVLVTTKLSICHTRIDDISDTANRVSYL